MKAKEFWCLVTMNKAKFKELLLPGYVLIKNTLICRQQVIFLLNFKLKKNSRCFLILAAILAIPVALQRKNHH